MSMETAMIAGVQFIEQRPTHDSNIEYWLAKCDGRVSEVFLLPRHQRERLKSLPNLIGFTQCQFVEIDEQLAVIMPGIIQIPTTQMLGKIGMTGCVGIAWHISDLLSLLHQSGRAHNLLHPESIGLNDLGELEIRPALGRYIPSDPDPKASSIATDCWQMKKVIQHLGLSEKADPLFALLQRGLAEEFSRLRLQPATAIRQSIAAVLARHTEWEDQFVENMGAEWVLNQRNLQENTIIPHRLKASRPTLSMDAVKDMSDSIDLWGNLFTSSSIDEASSSQALLLEALSGKTVLNTDGLASKIQLPSSQGEPIEQDSTALKIDLIGPTSIQVPVQAKRSGLVSIQEVGMDEALEVEEAGFYHGFSAIVEETAENLEVLHRRRRRSQSRRSASMNDETGSVLSLDNRADESPLIEVPSVDEKVEQSTLTGHEIEATEVISQRNTKHSDASSNPIDSEPESIEQTAVFVNECGADFTVISEPETGDENPLEASIEVQSDTSERDSSKEVSVLNDVQEVLEENVEKPIIIGAAADFHATESVQPSALGSTEEGSSGLHHPELAIDEVPSDQLVKVILPESSESMNHLQEAIPEEPHKNGAIAQGEGQKSESTELADWSEEAKGDNPNVHPNFHHVKASKVVIQSENTVLQEPDVELTEVIVQEDVVSKTPLADQSPLQEQTDGSSGPSSEEVDEQSDSPETTSSVSIFDMPLVSIVEEDDFGEEVDESEESEDEAGVSIQFLIDSAEPAVSNDQFEKVFESSDPNGSIESEQERFHATDDGFIATLGPESGVMSAEILDVEEPLAEIEFPSIEEVHAQDKAFAGDVNSLFDTAEPVVAPIGQISPKHQGLDSVAEPKWTGATSFDNLTNSENALGDEKYAYAQVELGDVDAVLGESIRDFSEMERRGSPWGLLLLVSLLVICAIVYVLSFGDEDSSSNVKGATNQETITGTFPELSQVEILTDPPQGTILIESFKLGVAPVQWQIAEGEVFTMCADWGGNPVCRKVPRSELQSGKYTFTQRLTP